MKIRTSEAAVRLGVHPLGLVLAVRPMVGGIEDCWPEIDDGFVETLRAAGYGQSESARAARHGDGAKQPSGSAPAVSPVLSVSHAAAEVLDKMSRQDKWGKNTVSLDTLRNHYCRTVSNVEVAVDELVDREFLLVEGGRKGTYSLNPARKGEIDRNVGLIRGGGA